MCIRDRPRSLFLGRKSRLPSGVGRRRRPGVRTATSPRRTPSAREHAMRRLVVLGAGTAGTMVVNKLRPKLPRAEWSITIVDPATQHYYQPGFLFLPFGTYQPKDVVRPLRPTLNLTKGIELISAAVDKVDGRADELDALGEVEGG